jgi:hypothetical protein
MQRYFELWRCKSDPNKGLILERIGTRVRIARLDPTEDNLFDSIAQVSEFVGEDLEFVEAMDVEEDTS